MKRIVACLSFMLPFMFTLSSAYADGNDGWRGQTAAHATSSGSTFKATQTAIVDTDGTVHKVKVSGGQSASPYEYKIHREPGICPDDALGQPQDLVFVDYRLVSAGPDAYWTPGEVFCAGPAAQTVDLGNIAAQVIQTVTESVKPPAPKVSARPDGTTLVNNPTVFTGSDLADQQPPALLNPLSGRSLQLTVRPTTWTWDFGDGSPTVTTDGPPPAYDGSLNGLLTHTYKKAADVRVQVTVTWTASYTISGVAGVQNVPNTVSSTATIPLRVRAARSQLVSR